MALQLHKINSSKEPDKFSCCGLTNGLRSLWPATSNGSTIVVGLLASMGRKICICLTSFICVTPTHTHIHNLSGMEVEKKFRYAHVEI